MARRGLRPLVLLLLVLTVTTAWLAFRAVQIRDGLLAARSQLAVASDELLQGGAAAEASASVAKARNAASDPVWRLAASVPIAGDSFAVAAEAAEAAGLLVDDVLPPLQEAVDLVRATPVLRDGRVDVELLRELQPLVDEASSAASAARTAAGRTGPERLPGAARELQAQLVDQTTRLDDGLAGARTALELAPAMLGADGSRRWFVAVMNNAEARGSGGLVGAYLAVRIEDGRIVREAVGTNDQLRASASPVVDLGPEFAEIYDRGGSRQAWQAAVETPHWPSAAAVMAGLWQAQGGGDVDGVIGIDPLVMQAVLAVTGPVTLEAGRTLSSADVADYVFKGEYEEFRGRSDGERREVLSELAEGIYDAVLQGGYAPLEMGRALTTSARSGHLQVWSEVEGEQRVLARSRVGGTLADVQGAYLQVVMNNAAGNKADVYVRRDVEYGRQDGGTATARVTLTNTVDAAAVPPIVVGRLDDPAQQLPPGTTRLEVSVYVGTGERVLGMTVDGAPVPFEAGTEQGHGFGTVVVEAVPGTPVVVAATVTDPGGPLLYRQQPLAEPDDLDLRVPHRLG